MSDTSTPTTPIADLRATWADLVAADGHTVGAAEKLTGARRARAEQLHEKICDAYVHCRRLVVFLEGDGAQNGQSGEPGL
jgi:hypothetical protein